MNDKLVILGGGESGVGAAVLAKKQGYNVFLSDSGIIRPAAKDLLSEYGIEYEEGNHSVPRIMEAAEVVKSPGIPDTLPLVEDLNKAGIPVISEIEFAGRFTQARKICITGSNGKTTTSSLIYYLLKNAGLNVGLAGNVGQSFAYQVATQNYDIYVLELSSFQLDGMYDFKADIAILLNITPDHLDRYHNDLKEYVKAKFRITQNMDEDDCFIFCRDDEISMEHLNRIVLKAKMLPISQHVSVPEGAYTIDNKMHVIYGEQEFEMFINELALQGKHNVYNSMAAALSAKIMNISNPVIRDSLTSFKNIPHRMEQVARVKGALYINDSKATNVNSVWYALDSIQGPVIWIVGGQDKGNDYASLADLVSRKVKTIVCLGKDNKKIINAFSGKVPEIIDTHSMEEAVAQSYRASGPGDTILLSPACASFDLFRNYEDRGDQFKEAVRKL
ncbi:MAG TPA: UDP-N-acetylmuramoyl-L-alanine--D-glutamate ligase [Bacteroidales bacterium]|nr:UDP-N-acetylmuramoyl-L-alanine--D-glutamate ligase [Bacteroidales bacterium]HRW94775.1 UDP-N-acetylmuramoyl-L-alanine--D-glutamate ligase [Bacteroidales bacterium]